MGDVKRMSEERLAEIRRSEVLLETTLRWDEDRTEAQLARRDLLAEVDALRAELSAFRRAVLTDGAGGTEEEVTPEVLEAELRLLRSKSVFLKEAVTLFDRFSLTTVDRYDANLFVRKVL